MRARWRETDRGGRIAVNQALPGPSAEGTGGADRLGLKLNDCDPWAFVVRRGNRVSRWSVANDVFCPQRFWLSMNRPLGLRDLARTVAAQAGVEAAAEDHDGAFPTTGVRALHQSGLLRAPFPIAEGGVALGLGDPLELCGILGTIGWGNLALGRLYEGHVNAVVLVARYGTSANLKLLKEETDAGRLSGVWMAGEALRIEDQGGRRVLCGRKILCSGAGHVRRPLVAAQHEGGSIMAIPSLPGDRSDASSWTAHGMRATATGTVDFDGIVIGDDEIVGRHGDYMRSPFFRGGAWRVIATQLGALEAVYGHYKSLLTESPNPNHPVQLVRFGEATIAIETARLWVRQAAIVAEGPSSDPAAIDAYVDLARNAFEGAALRVVALAQKAIGLRAFMVPNPMERTIRDLTTYLRQPALDFSLESAAAFHLGRP